MALEKIVNAYKKGVELKEKAKDKWLELGSKLSQYSVYRYAVDFSSGAIYYTTTYGIQELLSGKDTDAIIETRKMGLIAHAILLRYIGLRRNKAAKKYGVTKDSSFCLKLKANIESIVPVQAPAYALMLLYGMLKTNKWNQDSWESTGYSLLLGVGLSAFHAFPYGYVADKFRGAFGMKPAIDKKEELIKEYVAASSEVKNIV
jgi:hypothetical protein